MKDPIVLAMYARKGGAGRTIMCLQLAGACAEYGANVLVIDQDPQGSLSKNLFGASAVERLRPYETTAAIYDADISDYSRVIRQTEIPNIAIVPANDHLQPFDNFPDKQSPEHDRLQFALRDFVRSVQTEFDMVLIDTPPNVSNLPALAALNATRYVLTPVRPVKNSCEAIRDIKVRLSEVMQSSNSNLVDLGYFMTDYDRCCEVGYLPSRVEIASEFLQAIGQLHETESASAFLNAYPENWIATSLYAVGSAHPKAFSHFLTLLLAAAICYAAPLFVAQTAMNILIRPVPAAYGHEVAVAKKEQELGILRELEPQDLETDE